MKHSSRTEAIFADAALTPTARSRLEEFAALLLRWNRTVNLIARRDEAVLWDRHVADSLQLVPWLPPRITHAIDLGSGGGFPGLVLAIATGIPFDLIEADQRKAAFLREAARISNAPAHVHAERIQTVKVPPAPLITARALAPLDELLALATPKLTPDGVLLALKGRTTQIELTAASARWHMHIETLASRTSADGAILRISEIASVDAPSSGQI